MTSTLPLAFPASSYKPPASPSQLKRCVSTASQQQQPAEQQDEAPAGVTPRFYSEYTQFNYDLDRGQAPSNALRMLAYRLRTPEDANLFQLALRKWRTASQPQDLADNTVFLETLLRSRAYDNVLDIVCNRPHHNVWPNYEHVRTLMQAFASESVLAQTEEAKIEALDKVYKSFGVLLYYGIPPTAEVYATIIISGVYSGTSEGWRRSVVTAKEQVATGLPLTKDAEIALALGYLRAQEFEDAEVMVPASKFFAKVVTAKHDGEAAISAVEDLISTGGFSPALESIKDVIISVVGDRHGSRVRAAIERASKS
ncbi:hypothetical protein HDU85_007787 [Gaertneriomyces sp. JEL0708]|nr:hypothetical protein HDU85_007787 [Gaertneriomyces sp. JEL0708]